MEFSDPNQVLSLDRPFNEAETLSALRVDAASELDAINLYVAHADHIADPELRNVIQSIRADESEHLALFLAAIKHLDPVQSKQFDINLMPHAYPQAIGDNVDARMAALERDIQAFDQHVMTYQAPSVMPQQITETETGFRQVSPSEFVAARSGARRQEYLSPYNPTDLESMSTYLSDERTGYALTPELDLVNVFNAGRQPGAGELAVIDAIKHGAETLDAYAGFLPKYYSRFGFKTYNTLPWDDEYAPAGWDYDRFDRPDVVFMRYEGGDRNSIEDRIDTFQGYANPLAINPTVRAQYVDTREQWEDELRQQYGDDWVERNRFRLDREYEYLNGLGGMETVYAANIPASEYLSRRRRGDETAYTEQSERERVSQDAFNERLRQEIERREKEQLPEGTPEKIAKYNPETNKVEYFRPEAYPCVLPGEQVSEWVSGIGGSPGIVVDEAKALSTECIRINLGEGHKPLVYSAGIVGALDIDEQAKYCKLGYIEHQASEAQKARLDALANAAHICSIETKGAAGTQEHLTRYFSCLGRELKNTGVEP